MIDVMKIKRTDLFLSQGLTLWAVLFCLCLLPLSSQATVEIHPLDDIQTTANDFVLANIPNDDRETSVVSSKLDPRLRLKHCNQPLEAFYPEYGRRVGNVTVGIRCNGDNHWSIFVPMSVKIYRDIVTAVRPLNRGAVITEQDIKLEKRNISVFSSDYFTDPKQVIGHELVHSVQLGRSLSSNNLKSPTAIKRGNLVTLLAQNDVIEVRMEGKALSDGTIGQRIKVQNLRSKRVIEGVVKSNKIIYVE